MAINPITVTRLKTYVLLGHSNADGWAPSTTAFSPGSGGDYYPSTTNITGSPEMAFWKNIYVATSAMPWPGTEGTPTASSVADVDWLELNIANPWAPGDPHPHASPYDYPNNQGACYARWAYNSYYLPGFTYSTSGEDPPTPDGAFLGSPGVNWLGTRTGLEIPLSWHWRSFWQEQVGVCKLAFSSSFLMPSDVGPDAGVWLDPYIVGNTYPLILTTPARPSDYTPASDGYVRSAVKGGEYGFTNWWTPRDAWDFHPGTGAFYQKWFDKMVGAQAALPSGCKMDVRLVIPWMGDNDSQGRSQAVLRQDWKNTVLTFVDRIRSDLVANDWTTLNKSEIPIIWPLVHPGYPNAISPDFDSVSYCNSALQEIAADDEYFRTVDSSAWSVLTSEGQGDNGIVNGINHFGAAGYRSAALAIMTEFADMIDEPFDALDIDEAKTVSEAMGQVRVYYSRSRSNTDLSDEIVLQHLNGAMFHVFNHVGDNAWWLRRRLPLTITGGPSALTTLPRYVKRLLRIEDQLDATYPIQFEQIGHTDNGKLLIRMVERSTGTYNCSFISNPRELTNDNQIVPAPRQILEWIVVEACRRIAASASNAPLSAHFAGEARQLMEDCMRNSGATQRSKNDVMRTQRRRPRMGYRRGTGGSLWGSDY